MATRKIKVVRVAISIFTNTVDMADKIVVPPNSLTITFDENDNAVVVIIDMGVNSKRVELHPDYVLPEIANLLDRVATVLENIDAEKN